MQQKFDVHTYGIVRWKVTGVEAEDHLGAIAAVENDSELSSEFARRVEFYREGERIESIEADEGATPVGYLVDVIGDEDHSNSISYDMNDKGDPYPVGTEPGRNEPPNRFVAKAVLRCRGAAMKAIAEARDEFSLNRALRDVRSPVPLMLSTLLGNGRSSFSRSEALEELDRALETLNDAREVIQETPSACVRHLDYADLETPVFVDSWDNQIGTITREPGGLWRNAVYTAKTGERIEGLGNILHALDTVFGADVVLTLHPGYHALYRGGSEAPYARVIQMNDGRYALRVFERHRSEIYASLEAAFASIEG